MMKILTTPGYLSLLEGYTLYRYAKRAEHPIVEIGSWMGRSTLFLAYGAWKGTRQRVYAIDTWEGSTEHKGMKELSSLEDDFLRNIASAGFPADVMMLKGDSQELDIEYLPKKIGVLFIDGAHDYESVRADFLRYSPLVAHNGIVMFHDAAWWAPGVEQFISEGLRGWDKEVHTGSLAVFRRRV